MTRKDYRRIADAMLASKPAPYWDANKHAQYKVSVSRLCDALQADNPRFDRQKFMQACGVEQ